MTQSGVKKCPGGCGRSISANKSTCGGCAGKPQGSLSILNVGAGDIKIEFNTASISETIRAKRIITDMLRRGYALLVEVERDGERAWERVQQFDEKRSEYIIADFDAELAQEVDRQSEAAELRRTHAVEPPVADPPAPTRRGYKRVPMAKTKATAVGRSAGG